MPAPFSIDLPRKGNNAYQFLRGMQDRLVQGFLASLENPREAQQARLDVILERARGSAFGAEHDLDRVRTLEDLRAAVPIRDHAGHLPWLDRIADGEADVLTTERVTMLLETSGTTGKPKHLPVTKTWAKGVADAQALWVLGMVQEQEAVTKGKALTVVSPAVHAHSPGGLPIGSNTGRMILAQPWWLRLRYPVPYAVFCLKPPQVRQYAILRFALQAPLTTISTANPSTVLLLCRRLREWREPLSRDLADGTLRHGPARDLPKKVRRRLEWRLRRRPVPEDWRPAKLWPLAAINCWTAGPAAYFCARLPEALGADVPVREVGITASEGFFAIPLSRSFGPAGVLWNLGHVLEFLSEDGTPRWGWELEVGEQVRLVLTTEAGLYRYDIADRLEVVGRCIHSGGEATPVVRFLGKAGRYLNATGEKVTEDQVSEAMRRATSILTGTPQGGRPGWRTPGFTTRLIMGEVPAVELVVERGAGGDRMVEPPGDLPARFDAALRAINLEYDGKRGSERLGTPTLRVAPPGTFQAFRDLRVAAGAPEGQVKDPVITLGEIEWARITASMDRAGEAGQPARSQPSDSAGAAGSRRE